jgi:hypothetical protein
MIRRLVLASIVIFLATSLFAENHTYASLVPKTAKSIAMGGVFSAVQTSEFSFFGNPAAFASDTSILVLPSLASWAYVKPGSDNTNALLGSGNDLGSLLAALLPCMLENGGSGGGLSAGLGFAGKGIGVGLFFTSENEVQGSSPVDATAHSENEIAGIIGIGAPLKIGALKLSVGGNLRPFYRVSLHDKGYADISAVDLLVAMKESSGNAKNYLYADSFFGLAIDLGAILELGDVGVGLSIRDIAPSYPITTTSLEALEKTLASGEIPDASSSSEYAVFHPEISAGLSWKPKLKAGVIDPALYFELKDPIGVVQDWKDIGSALNLVHAGGEITIARFLALRGGFNQGWFSAGAGVKLLFIDVNTAVFSEATGSSAYDSGRSGLALQASIRF